MREQKLHRRLELRQSLGFVRIHLQYSFVSNGRACCLQQCIRVHPTMPVGAPSLETHCEPPKATPAAAPHRRPVGCWQWSLGNRRRPLSPALHLGTDNERRRHRQVLPVALAIGLGSQRTQRTQARSPQIETIFGKRPIYSSFTRAGSIAQSTGRRSLSIAQWPPL